MKSLGEIQQYADGLKTLNVASTLKDHKDIFEKFFSNDESLKEPLTAGVKCEFISVIFSLSPYFLRKLPQTVQQSCVF